jgi:tyrosyl-tRNA synthetase
VIEYLDQLLQPVRDHFENNQEAKQLLEEVRSFQITR